MAVNAPCTEYFIGDTAIGSGEQAPAGNFVNYRHKSITSRNLCIVAHELKYIDGITRVDLSSNLIGDDIHGMQCLCDVIRVSASIRTIDLKGNKLHDVHMEYFARCIAANPTLKHIRLSYNCITDVGAARLVGALGTNSDLEWIDLAHNQVSPSLIQSIESTLISRLIEPQIELQDNETDSSDTETFQDPRREMRYQTHKRELMARLSDLQSELRSKVKRIELQRIFDD